MNSAGSAPLAAPLPWRHTDRSLESAAERNVGAISGLRRRLRDRVAGGENQFSAINAPCGDVGQRRNSYDRLEQRSEGGARHGGVAGELLQRPRVRQIGMDAVQRLRQLAMGQPGEPALRHVALGTGPGPDRLDEQHVEQPPHDIGAAKRCLRFLRPDLFEDEDRQWKPGGFSTKAQNTKPQSDIVFWVRTIEPSSFRGSMANSAESAGTCPSDDRNRDRV